MAGIAQVPPRGCTSDAIVDRKPTTQQVRARRDGFGRECVVQAAAHSVAGCGATGACGGGEHARHSLAFGRAAARKNEVSAFARSGRPDQRVVELATGPTCDPALHLGCGAKAPTRLLEANVGGSGVVDAFVARPAH